MTLGRLDYLYTPSRDVAADARYLVDVLGGELAFAIEDGGTRVAMVRFPWSPAILVTDHLEGDRPIQIHAVDDLETTATALEARGWIPERTLEVPPGPCRTFRTPGGIRMAIYEPTRPFVVESFGGRRDFA
jgi:hypothetical protein